MSENNAHLPNINSLKEKLPDIWNENARLDVLYAPLRNESVNPADWQSKFQFWNNVINIYCDNFRLYTFTLADLIVAFKNNGRSPCCLDKVVNVMHKNSELCDIDQFNKKGAETWSGWATDLLIKRPLTWSFNKLQTTLLKKEKQYVYVHLQTVQNHADRLYMTALNGEKYKIFEFHELLVIGNVNNNGLNILLHSLCMRNKASVMEVNCDNASNQKFIVKLGNIEKVGKISEVEMNIYILQETEKTLSKNMHGLEEKISKLTNEAKEHLKKGYRETAKASLRKKRLFDQQVQKSSSALFNVQELLMRLQNTLLDKEVLDVYKTSLSSLKSIFNESEMNVDNITTTMLEIGEVLDIHDDVQDALKQPINDTDIDFEAELDELMSTENENTNSNQNNGNVQDSLDNIEEAFMNLKLPSVPKGSPKMEAI